MSMYEVLMASVVFYAIYSVLKNFTDFLLKRKIIKAGHFENAGILEQKSGLNSRRKSGSQ